MNSIWTMYNDLVKGRWRWPTHLKVSRFSDRCLIGRLPVLYRFTAGFEYLLRNVLGRIQTFLQIQDKRQKDLESNLMSHGMKLPSEGAVVTALMLGHAWYLEDSSGCWRPAKTCRDGGGVDFWLWTKIMNNRLATAQLKTCIKIRFKKRPHFKGKSAN